MNYQLIPKELRPIAEKVEAQQRISEADALMLYGTNDLNALGMIANVERERKNGNSATYIHNRYINYSNICILSCQFCAFAARKRDAHAFEYAIDEIVQAVTDALPLGVTEVHMVGGLHPTLKKEWYLDLLKRLRALDPQLHIKAFTAIEARHLAQRVFKMPIRETLEILHPLERTVEPRRRDFQPLVIDAFHREGAGEMVAHARAILDRDAVAGVDEDPEQSRARGLHVHELVSKPREGFPDPAFPPRVRLHKQKMGVTAHPFSKP